MAVTLISLFAIGYILIACEHTLHINKAIVAMMMCGLLWSCYALGTADPGMAEDLKVYLGETSEILFFLIGAMTIVEIIDRYGGFVIITNKIHAKSKRQLLWMIAIVAFFMSAVLDNLTTTIVMVTVTNRLISDKKDRWMFASMIVIAANSGGAFSPIGDVTTIMLWMNSKVTTSSVIANLFIPSLVSLIVPMLIVSRFMKNSEIEPIAIGQGESQAIYKHYPQLSKFMLILGVAGLLAVPVIKSVTDLPPYFGMLISLGVVWLVTEIIIRKYDIDSSWGAHATQAMRGIDLPTILFFLGILMSVSALGQAGMLENLSTWMDTTIHEPFTMTTIIGYLSAIIDNVPLVQACIIMFGDVSQMFSLDPGYYTMFLDDGLFWHLLTFTAGVGGSMLIIGSAAGVVAMGIEKIPFFWYLKRITLLAMSGFLAGIFVIWLESLCPLFF